MLVTMNGAMEVNPRQPILPGALLSEYETERKKPLPNQQIV